MKLTKKDARLKRKARIRKKLSGTSERPRLVVFRSNKHLYCQLVNDETGETIASSSTLVLAKEGTPAKLDVASAALIGKDVATKAKEKNITRVVFDRNGFIYHGRVKALADGAREAGLEF